MEIPQNALITHGSTAPTLFTLINPSASVSPKSQTGTKSLLVSNKAPKTCTASFQHSPTMYFPTSLENHGVSPVNPWADTTSQVTRNISSLTNARTRNAVLNRESISHLRLLQMGTLTRRSSS
ncbi:hypothetical protein FOPG_19675 [Fusarium oxysporum f. sp. conglutinans race 2 54008]|uniref:Uncharacterized protein n=1 Tax=Fusarium oxysporum f. sp. conglutinans race 2 54008 TaxID=1089457 RepID=X0GW56_FUSOX|nr:hypothetical protein FOPG_19675 [Fusarium oxysporum f. sp. conglutinans race 2 54008]